MAKLITTLPDLAFPYEIDEFEIQTSIPAAVRLTLSGRVIFDVTVEPTADSYRFKRVAPYLIDALDAMGRDNFEQELAIWVDGVAAKRLYLIPCCWHLDMTARDFISRNFMTLAGIKRTTLESDEVLSVWFAPNEPPLAPLRVGSQWFNDGARKLVRTIQEIAPLKDNGDVAAYDVSPRRLTPPTSLDGPWRLLSYRVELGSRHMTYEIEPVDTLTAPPATLRFINAFGEADTFHFFGYSEHSCKPKYSSARIDGQLRNYATTAVPERKLKTGPFSPTSRLHLMDLAKSLDVTDANGTPMVLSECDIKESTRYSDMLYGSVTIRESEEVLRLRTKQIFDATFDITYE